MTYHRDIFEVNVVGEVLPEEAGLFPAYFEGHLLATQYADIISDHVWTEAQKNGTLSTSDLKIGKTSWKNRNKGRYSVTHHKLFLAVPVPGEVEVGLRNEPKTMIERMLDS